MKCIVRGGYPQKKYKGPLDASLVLLVDNVFGIEVCTCEGEICMRVTISRATIKVDQRELTGGL
jgi:hypothetical protein